MRANTAIMLWAIAAGWAIIWLFLHYFRPSPFPLIGVPAGLVIVAPLLVMNWRERRKSRERSQDDHHSRR